jgi:hypothetical protein
MRYIVLLLIFLAACRGRYIPPPVESYDQVLRRTEGVTCADITGHADGPEPSCARIVDAFGRGRNRVAAVYDQARDIHMDAIVFLRPALLWPEDKPYPVIANWTGTPRGVFVVEPPQLILYAYENCVEHEVVHFLMYRLFPDRMRTAEAIAADPGSAFDVLDKLYMVQCHGTSDDLFGEPGNRGSCALPYQP